MHIPGDFKQGLADLRTSPPAGSKRQRVSRTTILDTGEEVTEDVWEDGEASQAAPAEPHSNESSPAGQTVTSIATIHSRLIKALLPATTLRLTVSFIENKK